MEFSKNLKLLRKSEKLTQNQLSEILKVDRTTVVNYENGRREPNLEMLCRIADYFKVTTDYLLGRE